MQVPDCPLPGPFLRVLFALRATLREQIPSPLEKGAGLRPLTMKAVIPPNLGFLTCNAPQGGRRCPQSPRALVGCGAWGTEAAMLTPRLLLSL